jgi:hypothetical protein
MTLFGGLARYARPGPDADAKAGSACELCAAALTDGHGHVVDLSTRRLLCACRPCALLFSQARRDDIAARYRAVPDRVLFDPDFVLDATSYERLEIPVELAFFGRFGSERWVAIYPSPVGATESELPLDAWPLLVDANPLLAAVERDVEALLVRAPRGERRFEAFLVPVDLCYELVGRLRSGVRSISGAGADEVVDGFFDEVRARSRPLRRHLEVKR